jgi:hypothetical protein
LQTLLGLTLWDKNWCIVGCGKDKSKKRDEIKEEKIVN